MSVFFQLLIFFGIFVDLVWSRTKCVRVTGRIHCATDWDRHYNVVVRLMDKDPLPWETDDVMGETITDEDGNFNVEGCADDFGSWNDPDPYLFIEHRCPEPGHTISIPHRRKIVSIDRKYQPDTIYIETIRIDENDRD